MNNKVYRTLRRSLFLILFEMDKLFGRRVAGVVLCYHSIDNDKWKYSVAPEQFKKQIKYLLGNFRPNTLDNLRDYLEGRAKPKSPFFIITFDDGYKNLTRMAEFLNTNGVKPAVFVVSEREKVNRQQLLTNKQLLSQKEIQALISLGWTVGCHSSTHVDLTRIGNDELKYEIYEAKKKLESGLGIKVDYFAYPKGNYTAETLNKIAEAGFRLGLTTDSYLLRFDINSLVVPRIGIDQTYDLREFQAVISPSVITLKGLMMKSFLRRYVQ